MGEQVAAGINGGVAQLGEHLPCKQGVMSSNLTISTKAMRRGNPGGHRRSNAFMRVRSDMDRRQGVRRTPVMNKCEAFMNLSRTFKSCFQMSLTTNQRFVVACGHQMPALKSNSLRM